MINSIFLRKSLYHYYFNNNSLLNLNQKVLNVQIKNENRFFFFSPSLKFSSFTKEQLYPKEIEKQRVYKTQILEERKKQLNKLSVQTETIENVEKIQQSALMPTIQPNKEIQPNLNLPSTILDLYDYIPRQIPIFKKKSKNSQIDTTERVEQFSTVSQLYRHSKYLDDKIGKIQTEEQSIERLSNISPEDLVSQIQKLQNSMRETLSTCTLNEDNSKIIWKITKAKINKMLRIQHALVNYQVKPKQKIYSLLISGCAAIHSLTEANYLYNQMIEFEISPNKIILDSMIEAATHGENLPLAAAILEDYKKFNIPFDISCFEKVLNLCSQMDSVQIALNVFSILRETDLKITFNCYASVLAILPIFNYNLAKIMLQEFTNKGFKLSYEIYLGLFRGLAVNTNSDSNLDLDSNSNIDKAFELYEQMKQNDIHIDVVIYSYLIDICAQNPNLALKIFNEACACGSLVCVDTQLCNRIIRILCNHNQPEKAQEIVCKMGGPLPATCETLSILTKSYLKLTMWHHAVKVRDIAIALDVTIDNNLKKLINNAKAGRGNAFKFMNSIEEGKPFRKSKHKYKNSN
eukprot:TRINITY_DN3211_c0_g1_i1.p1 TRINITY_DN3211_c0_g1~~TRINITY_DN3211_c0_g1_i1.p1  ORF type:complete len:576 (+),score=218.59 TRINITY_DN3211_c0_g1_i1:71-1798(+)